MVGEGASTASGRTEVFRATQSVVIFSALVLLCVVLVVDTAFRGQWLLFARVLPAILLVVWAGWLFLYRSSIRVGRDRVTVINMARVHEVPWAAIAGITRTGQLLIDLRGGRTLRLWGAPFAPRRRSASFPAYDALSLGLEQSRHRAPKKGMEQQAAQQMTSRWDVASLIVGAVCVVAIVVTTGLPA